MFLRLNLGPVIVMMCLALKVLQFIRLGTMNNFSPEMKKEMQFLSL